jgi:hypothetical protein
MAVPLFHAVGLAAQIRAAAENGVPAEFIAKLIAKVPFAIAPETEELSLAFLESLKAAEVVAATVLHAAPVVEAEAEPEPARLVEEATFPLAEQMAALPKISTQPAALVLRGSNPEPQQATSKSQNAHFDATFVRPAVAIITRMEPLAMTNGPRALAVGAGAAGDAKAGDLHGYLQAMEMNAATGAPSMKFGLTPAAPVMQLAAGNGYSVLNGAGVVPAKLNATSASSIQALELQSETSSPSLHFASQSLELNLRPAPGCRYDVQSQSGPIQQPAVASSGAADEFSITPAPVKQLATQSLELGLGMAGLCELSVQSAAGTALPVGSGETLAAPHELRFVALPDGLVKTALNPTMVGIRPLAFAATACTPSASRWMARLRRSGRDSWQPSAAPRTESMPGLSRWISGRMPRGI